MHDFIPHTELRDGMNTDDLCEVWLSFITYHGLEQESDECDNDAAKLRDHLAGAPVCEITVTYAIEWLEWLDRYIVAWGKACDAEWRMGHGIAPHHGWTNHFEDDDVTTLND